MPASEGCVIGFTKLLRVGKKYRFHPKFLKIHLMKLTAENKITIDKIGKQYKYCLKDFDPDKESEKFNPDLKKLKIKLDKSDIKMKKRIPMVAEFVRLSLREYNQYNVGWLHWECCEKDKNNIKIIEKKKKDIETRKTVILNSIRDELNKLDKMDRKNIINTF